MRSVGVAGRQGFTLVEMMIAVGIIGILASLSVPTFSKYKQTVLLSEATTHLNTMFKGQADLWARSHCRVTCMGPKSSDAVGGYELGEGGAIQVAIEVPDPGAPVAWPWADDGRCQQVNFSMSGPTRFAYVGFVTLSSGQNYLGWACVGSTDPVAVTAGLHRPVNAGQRAYENSAFYRFADESIGQYSEYIHNNADGTLFRAGREFKPEWTPGCAVRPTTRVAGVHWLLAVASLVLVRRRSARNGHG